MSIKLIAIIAPHRAPTEAQVLQHIEAAKALGTEVARLGAYPVIPHANTAHMRHVQPESFWLDGTLGTAKRCDAGMLGDGWESSERSCRERSELLAQGKPVFDELEALAQWLSQEGD